MAVVGTRPRRNYLSLDDYEKQAIIKLWNEFKGSGVIGNTLGLPSSTVQAFLVKNGFKRSKQEQIDGQKRLRESK
jgi:hypothetical protein